MAVHKTKSGVAGLAHLTLGTRYQRLHRSETELFETLAGFCEAGIEEGELCVVLGPTCRQRLQEQLPSSAGRPGDLLVLPPDRHLDQRLIDELVREAGDRGLGAVRIAREADFASSPVGELSTRAVVLLDSYDLEAAPTEVLREFLRGTEHPMHTASGVGSTAASLSDDGTAKDEFIAMLGHELRNPLAPIVTALDLIELRRESDPFRREHRIIDRQVRHVASLVDDMLDISRITRGKIALRRGAHEIHEVVQEAIHAAGPLLEERYHTLVVDMPRHGLLVEVDSDRMAQVLTNILINAAQYTPVRGRITVSAERIASGDVCVSIKDNGRGIAPDRIGRVFEPFEQCYAQQSDRSDGGLGLGLAIARTLVELHDGSIDISSTVGTGTEVRICIPTVHAVPSHDEPSQERLETTRRRETRVLVVDDNSDAAEMLAEYLDAVGYEVRVAHDGPSAIEVAAEFRPATALLDIGLPVMDGYELAEKLVQRCNLSDLKLIAVTGYGQEKDRERSRRAGFDEHMVKPVDIGELLRLLPSSAAAE